MLVLVLQILGAFSLFGIFRCFLPFVTGFILGGHKLKKGKWAVVTGATDGIGEAYCDALAKKGLNICLISRTEAKLKSKAEELSSKFKVETCYVAADFSKASEKGFETAIAAKVGSLDVAILVNNVGMSYPYPKWFAMEDHEDQLVADLVNLNCVSTTLMTRVVLPAMVKAKGGAIINISSAAGNMPCGSPGLAAYSASKGYVNMFSKSIHHEQASAGIVCQTHVPYFVVSKLSKIRKPSLMTPTPKDWVASSLRMLGRGGSTVVPYFWHFVQDFVALSVPEEVIGWYTKSLHASIRKRALKKLDKAQ